MNEELLKEIVNLITTPPYKTISQCASQLGLARNTVKRYVDLLLTEDSLYYDEIISKRVKSILDKLLQESRSKAGSIGRKKSVLTKEDALEMRYRNVYEAVPLRVLAKEKGCSHTAVANAIKSLSAHDIKAQDAGIK